MLFAIYALDKAGDGSARMTHRPAHLEYLKSKSAVLKAGGALLDDAGEKMVGSMIIIEAPDLAAAKAFAEGDPFKKNGVFESVVVRPWRVAPLGSVSFG